MFRNIGTTEIILILAVVVLLFGAKRLPDLARGTGRALRIFKAEVKDLRDDDDRPESSDSTHADPSSSTTARIEPSPVQPRRDPAATPDTGRTDTTRHDTPPDRG